MSDENVMPTAGSGPGIDTSEEAADACAEVPASQSVPVPADADVEEVQVASEPELAQAAAPVVEQPAAAPVPTPPAVPVPPAPAPPYAAPAAPAVPASDKNKVAAALLGILLGSLGIHKFYLGYTKEGVIMLVVSVLSFGTLSGAVAIVGLVEGILYLTKTDEEFYVTYVANKRPWF